MGISDQGTAGADVSADDRNGQCRYRDRQPPRRLGYAEGSIGSPTGLMPQTSPRSSASTCSILKCFPRKETILTTRTRSPAPIRRPSRRRPTARPESPIRAHSRSIRPERSAARCPTRPDAFSAGHRTTPGPMNRREPSFMWRTLPGHARRLRRGFTILEAQVAFVLLGIGLAGICPLVVMQLKISRVLARANIQSHESYTLNTYMRAADTLTPATTYLLAPPVRPREP